MRKPRPSATTGLWLTGGGLIILAAHQLLAVYEPELSVDNLVLLAGAIAGYLATATGILLSLRYRARGEAAATRAGEPLSIAAPAGEDRALSQHGDPARQMITTFLAWCEEDLPDGNLWNPFDQLVREFLTERLGAVRVRCYQVLPGNQQLRSLSQLGATDDESIEGRCARSGILGHVATTGQEFDAADPTQGELVHQLAQDADEPWDWVCPIRQSNLTVGLVAVGKLPPPALLDRTLRQNMSTVIAACWKHVVALEQLRIARKTDKATGLLTRADFFELATRALADSYRENEPVIVVIFALEGLRRLDDVGHWQQRDALVEAVGRVIKRRIRTDDIIGRFSDDRFVLLLRRLDSGLGRLIAAKIQSAAEERIEQLGELSAGLHVRGGLAGSGFQKEALETLLVSAFDAVELARKQNIALHCDVAATKQEATPA
jgi:diguanylate cyclase (GGDEF)-like protein